MVPVSGTVNQQSRSVANSGLEREWPPSLVEEKGWIAGRHVERDVHPSRSLDDVVQHVGTYKITVQTMPII